MSCSEFELISKYFRCRGKHDQTVQCGIGDDAAIIQIPEHMELVVTTDTLLQGTHFPTCTSAADIAYKALAVNLSDMAAMGAMPRWALLAITLPDNDETWLAQFADSFFETAGQYQLSLIGGDMSRGPLSVNVQIQGLVPTGTALRRSAAQQNDFIYVTGTLGDAGVGLDIITQQCSVAQQHKEFFIRRFNRPEINIATGQQLRSLANSAIDISDGLLADLGHLLSASSVGADINMEEIPLSSAMQSCIDQNTAWNYALTAGDDYHLCFTASAAQQIIEHLKTNNIATTCIGRITASGKLRCLRSDGTEFQPTGSAYSHF